jgi:predicted MPP superfamily phosphohydrolase
MQEDKKKSYFLKIVFVGLIITITFVLIDTGWLLALPRLNISYGIFVIPLFVFSFIRMGFYFYCLIFQLRLYFRQRIQFVKSYCWALLIPNLLLLALGIYGFYIEPFNITTNKIEITVKNLEQPIRIVQLSDLHIENITQREKDTIENLDQIAPDMIVITGDFANLRGTNDQTTINSLREFVRQIHAPLGIYAVNGNYESIRRLETILAGSGIKILDNEINYLTLPGRELAIIGICFEEWFGDDESFIEVMGQVKPNDYKLLLYHTPNLAYLARDLDVDLYLTGHTHGGQVRLPFYGAIITNTKYGKTFEMGKYQLDNMIMYVNRGLGFAGGLAPRIRLLAPPEILIIDLLPEN